MNQNDDKYTAFNKHVVAELVKQDALALHPALAYELKTHVEQCAARKQGSKGSALLNIMLSIQHEVNSAQDFQEFVRKNVCCGSVPVRICSCACLMCSATLALPI